jgi:transcriptional regulator with XRE-family HTH domain
MQGKRICVSVTPQQHALGRAVRELRVVRFISQEELGFRARLHRNYIGAIERGTINPTFRTLLRLTVGLRIKLSDLILVYERQTGDRLWPLAGTTT